VRRSYELGPNLSGVPGSTAAAEMGARDRWGEQVEPRISRIQALGAAEGIELNLHLARPVNTFDAHRLVHLAADRGRADQVLDALFRAYHTRGSNVADPDVLKEVGAAAGLRVAEVGDLLAGEAYASEVRADEHRAMKCGINGVPTLVIEGGPPIHGVLPTETLRHLLKQTSGIDGAAADRRHPRVAREVPSTSPRHRLRRARPSGIRSALINP